MKKQTFSILKYLSGKHEKYIVTALFIAFWGILSYYLYLHQIDSSLGDTTFASQILYNFKHTLSMQTSFGVSIAESIDHIWYQPADYVCSLPLKSETSVVPWGHFYFIMYAIAPFAKIMSIPVLIAVLQAGIYAFILLFAYLISRKNNLSIFVSTLFVIFVSQHPLWLGGLEGQFYFNRIFLLFSGLIILLLDKNKINYPLIILASIFAASTNEIYGISVFLILISYLWIYRQKNIKLFFIAFLFLAISIFSLIYIQQTLGMNSTQTGYIGKTFGTGISTIINTIIQNFQNQKTIAYILINTIFLGILAFFRPRLLFPLFLILFPNIFVNLGGAEKTGWATHYHISYFIPLIWLSILGLTNQRFTNRTRTLLLIILVFFSAYINPIDLSKNIKPIFAIQSLYNKINYSRLHGQYQLDFRNQLRQAIGSGSVSAPEAIVYNLYDHDIYYYPININQVDNVIFRVDDTKEGRARFYTPNYGHQDPNLDSCILARMEKNGYNLDNPIIISGWAVIKKL